MLLSGRLGDNAATARSLIARTNAVTMATGWANRDWPRRVKPARKHIPST
jgi:hypothetical protein